MTRSYLSQVHAHRPSGFWRLGEASGSTAEDSSGFGRSGSYVGGVTLGGAAPIAGSNTSASFDGIDGRVSIGDVSSLNFTTDVTVEAWIKLGGTSWNTYGPIASKYGATGGYFLIRDYQTAQIRWQGSAAYGSSVFVLWSPAGLNDGLWHHVAGVYSSVQHLAALYVDGALVNSRAGVSGAIASTTSPFQIGAWHTPDTFGGKIDDVAVYDHPLSAEQVAQHYAARTVTAPDAASYTIAPNPFAMARVGSLRIAGQVIEVSQAGLSCGATVTPSGVSVGPDASIGNLAVSIAPGCRWTSESNTSWLRPGDASPGYAAQVRADSPLGYWRLSESSGTLAVDSSGHDRLGAYTGGVTLSVGGALGDRNRAARFDGFTGKVILGADPAFGLTTQFAVEAWVQFTSIENYGPIVSKYGADGGYFLMRDGHSGRFRWQGKGTNDASVFALWSPAAYNDGLWHHVVGVYDGAQRIAALYVDGALVNRIDGIPSAIAISARPLEVGSWYTDGTFNGTIDEIALYDRALTDTQIARHYALRGLAGTDAISYSVSPTTTSLTRSATLTIAGQPVLISQAGGTCVYSASPSARTFDASGGSDSAVLTTLDGCAWTATSNNSWITMSATSGQSSASVAYTVGTNTTPNNRTGTITIGQHTISVTQAACGYSLSPATSVLPGDAAQGSVAVSAADACEWTATSQTPWLRVVSPDGSEDPALADGTTRRGSGAVVFAALKNAANTPRSGAIAIAGQALIVTQAAAPCDAVVSPSDVSIGSNATNGSSTISIPDGCSWTATSSASWLGVSPSVPYASVVRLDDPVGYWRLNESSGPTAWDSSGEGLHGSYFGGVNRGATGATHDGDLATLFNGSNAYVAVAAAPAEMTSALTVEAWVKFTARDSYGPIVSKYGGDGGYFLIRDSYSGSIRWQGKRGDDVLVFGLWSPGSLHDGLWHHVVGVYSGSLGQAALYIDGTLVNSATGTAGAIAASMQPLEIGRWFGGDTFAGGIDEVAIYDHALTAAQVAQHFAARAARASHTVAYSAVANQITLPRTGVVSVAGQTITVTQAAAPCAYALSTATPWAGSWNAASSFTVTTSPNCTWSTSGSPVPWMALQTTASAGYRDRIRADSPAGYWRLDELSGSTAMDSSNFGHTGTYVGGVSRWHGGSLANGNAAATFDGMGGRITMGDVAALNLGSELSVEAWVAYTPSSGASSTPIVGKVSEEDGGYVLLREDPSGQIRWLATTGDQPLFTLSTTGLTLNNGLWHHIVGTYSASQGLASLYVDGVLRDSVSGVAGAIPAGTGPFQIAAWASSAGTFKGAIDEVAVYDHPLTPQQIQEHHAFRHESTTGSGSVTYYMELNPSDKPRSVTFTVAGQTVTLTQNGSLPWLTIDDVSSPNRVTARGDGTVSVTVGDPHGNPYDAVLLFRHGDPDTAYIDWQYVTGGRTLSATGVRQATLNFTIPPTPGEYDLRLFTENIVGHVAISPTIIANGPYISLTGPVSGSTFTAGDAVTLTAYASDWGGMVARVDFYVDGMLVGTATSAPWQREWIATGGATGIAAVATDTNGLRAVSNVAAVTINGGSASGGTGGGVSPTSATSGESGSSVLISSQTDWNTFSADISIVRARIGTELSLPLAPRTTRYRWERSSASGSWRTAMTFISASPTSVSTLDGPGQIDTLFGVSRVEDDEDGSPLRFYDRRGILIQPMSDHERQQLELSIPFSGSAAAAAPSPVDWIDAVIVPLSERDLRRASLERRFGPAHGVVNGLDRYVIASGSTQREVLVDPERAVPIETNVVHDGVLVTHQTFAYTAATDGRFVRTMIRLEQLVPDGSGDRVVSTVEFSNIQLSRR